MFKVNDLVTIVQQPTDGMNHHIQMQGLSGYIEEIVGEYAQFVELNEKGYGGVGGVPLSCLRLANDNQQLQRYKQIKDDAREKLRKESEVFNQKLIDIQQKHMTKFSEEFHLPMEEVEKIFESIAKYHQEIDAACSQYYCY